MELSNHLYEALNLKYKAQIAEAKATMLIYFNNCVGIGEHPQQLEEMDKLVEKISSAEDNMENLAKHFSKFDKNNVCVKSD
jgi:uncharacterized protein (DUF342 family)